MFYVIYFSSYHYVNTAKSCTERVFIALYTTVYLTYSCYCSVRKVRIIGKCRSAVNTVMYLGVLYKVVNVFISIAAILSFPRI